MQERDSLGQRELARLERVRAYLRAHPPLFAAQGSVVATWRSHGRRRLGPYYQLAWRESGRQRWLYLGRSEELAERVRRLLATLQARRRGRRLMERLKAQVRASLRRSKRELNALLAPWGIQLKGFEFRGVRQALPRYAEVYADVWRVGARQDQEHRYAVGCGQGSGRGDPPDRAVGRTAGGPNTEKRRLVNQTAAARFAAVQAKLARHPVVIGAERTSAGVAGMLAEGAGTAIWPLLSGAISRPTTHTERQKRGRAATGARPKGRFAPKKRGSPGALAGHHLLEEHS